MQSKDLRIGNLIFDDINGIHEITSIDDIELGLGSDAIEFKYAKPIPLTMDWLLKFKFSKEEYMKGYIGIDVCSTSFVLAEPNDFKKLHTFPFTIGGIQMNKKIEFVHQLQNLYFALTGEELELKSESKP